MKSQSVLVTGAGSGIGLATALYLARKGYQVYAGVLDDTQKTALETLAHDQALALKVLCLDITQADQREAAPLSVADLRAMAGEAGSEITYTCVPPGSGIRMGLDRDEDGVYDGDERAAGSNPADPLSMP